MSQDKTYLKIQVGWNEVSNTSTHSASPDGRSTDELLMNLQPCSTFRSGDHQATAGIGVRGPCQPPGCKGRHKVAGGAWDEALTIIGMNVVPQVRGYHNPPPSIPPAPAAQGLLPANTDIETHASGWSSPPLVDSTWPPIPSSPWHPSTCTSNVRCL